MSQPPPPQQPPQPPQHPPRQPAPPPGFPPGRQAGPPNRPPMGPPPHRPVPPPPQQPQQPRFQQPPPPQPAQSNRPTYRPQAPQGPGQAPAQQPPYPRPPQQPPFQQAPYRQQQPAPTQPPVQPPAEPPAPETPRRKDVPKTSWLGRIVGGVVVLALGAATVVLSDMEVKPSDLMPAFVTEGQAGKVVTTRAFKVRIDKPFVARELTVQELSFGDPKPLTTSGVWLVVPAAVQPQLEPLQFDGATILAKSGKKYASTRLVPDSFQPAGQGSAPGIAFLGNWAFEIPPEEIPGAKIEVSAGIGEPLLESVARVDLGVGSDLVAKARPKYAFKKDDS